MGAGWPSLRWASLPCEVGDVVHVVGGICLVDLYMYLHVWVTKLAVGLPVVSSLHVVTWLHMSGTSVSLTRRYSMVTAMHCALAEQQQQGLVQVLVSQLESMQLAS